MTQQTADEGGRIGRLRNAKGPSSSLVPSLHVYIITCAQVVYFFVAGNKSAYRNSRKRFKPSAAVISMWESDTEGSY